MPQLCNTVYAKLADGMSKVERAKLDADLAPPEEKEVHVAKQNQAVMQQLAGVGVLKPVKKR